jgi:uncharacterized protein (TIGR00297 family)
VLTQITIGIVLAAIVTLAAWRLHALTANGTIAAFVVGAIIFGVAGWPGAFVLFAFFVPSTILSRIGRQRKAALVDIGKHGARDFWQVAANGGVATLCVALAAIVLTKNSLHAAFAGAFAAASADTWGTEIGTLMRGKPRSILSLRPIKSGLSGGITAGGSIAELTGAAFVALVAMLAGIAAFLPVAAGGLAGAIVDSLLGGSLQALRWCPACGRACETDPHHCGKATTLRRGIGWFGNDAVNVAASLTGAAVAGILAAFMPTAR